MAQNMPPILQLLRTLKLCPLVILITHCSGMPAMKELPPAAQYPSICGVCRLPLDQPETCWPCANLRCPAGRYVHILCFNISEKLCDRCSKVAQQTQAPSICYSCGVPLERDADRRCSVCSSPSLMPQPGHNRQQLDVPHGPSPLQPARCSDCSMPLMEDERGRCLECRAR